MELNKNSKSARLYRWYYATEELPTNLCPYFWKLVIMYALILPFVIFCLPSLIVGKFKFDKKKQEIGYNVFLYVGLYVLFCVVLVPIRFFITYESLLFTKSFLIGVVVIICGAAAGIMYLSQCLMDKYEEAKNTDSPKIKKTNILVEMVKAKYHKYCPQIKWK